MTPKPEKPDTGGTPRKGGPLPRPREDAFAAEMARMARDPEVRRASRRIEREGRGAEGDGLHPRRGSPPDPKIHH